MRAAIEGSPVDVIFDVNAPSVCIPKDFLDDKKFNSVTIKFGSGSYGTATVKVPSDALKDSDLSECFAITVKDSDAQESAFELEITGSLTTKFDSKVTVTIGTSLPSDAYNIRFHCLDTGEYIDASYTGGNVTAQLGHFSTWAIVYDVPAKHSDDDDDDYDHYLHYLKMLEQKRAAEAAEAAKEKEQQEGADLLIAIFACIAVLVTLITIGIIFNRK